MNAMLWLIFLCIILGLSTRRFGRREAMVVAIFATGLTAYYLFVPGSM